MSDLKDLVVVAGPNGCGKTCIFDAIRLMKSSYGGYQENEWMQWFGEFGINPQSADSMTSIFRDPAAPVQIRAVLRFAEEELTFLRENAARVCEPLAWIEITNTYPDTAGGFDSFGYQARFPGSIPQVAERVDQMRQKLESEASVAEHAVQLLVSPEFQLTISPSLITQVTFQTYEPNHLGALDFYSASRAYGREGVGGVNLDVRSFQAQRKTQMLYNSQAKYQNIKTEMLSTYLRQLVSREGGAEEDVRQSLDETLKHLFRTFFPDKMYLGIQARPDGTVEFPVQLKTGERHDINDLSSGEKEVLYGYLRLRNSTPMNSVILLDEPELHMNPGLVRGFADFYQEHFLQPGHNQMWLVTHSDALLRQAAANPEFSVFHMVAALHADAGNQAKPVGRDALQQALIDLVGDLAAYQPTAPVLILEGGGETDFDKSVVERLFPAVAERANIVSGSHKGRVQELYRILSETAAQTGLADNFYAITDADSDPIPTGVVAKNVTSWDVYHIENYLMDFDYIFALWKKLKHDSTGFTSAGDVEEAFKALAESSVDGLVMHKLTVNINDQIVRSVKIGGKPNSADPAADIMSSVTRTFTRLSDLSEALTDATALSALAANYRAEFLSQLASGAWQQRFPARVLLKKFVTDHIDGLTSYEGFLNLIIADMILDSHEPPGMKSTLEALLP